VTRLSIAVIKMKHYVALFLILLFGLVTSINNEFEYSQNEDSSVPRSIFERGISSQNEIKERRRQAVQIRAKRSLIIPGTNWCGVGNVSRDNNAVGDMAAPDQCCRDHDHCPWTIEGMTTKYNMYNYRMTTISHCECDDIFRTCLRMASSPAADVVGELFFNYLGMKCFIFKRETYCAQRAWWGKCERQATRQAAELRDPLTY